MRTHKAGTAICSAILVFSTTPPAIAEATCERETIAMSASPDNQWIALVREGECFNGPVTVSTDTVQLLPRAALDAVSLARSPDKPEHENDVLVVDYYGRSENRPLLKWLSPRELQATIPVRSGIGLKKSTYHDVAITVRLEPDDPPAREGAPKP